MAHSKELEGILEGWCAITNQATSVADAFFIGEILTLSELNLGLEFLMSSLAQISNTNAPELAVEKGFYMGIVNVSAAQIAYLAELDTGEQLIYEGISLLENALSQFKSRIESFTKEDLQASINEGPSPLDFLLYAHAELFDAYLVVNKNESSPIKWLRNVRKVNDLAQSLLKLSEGENDEFEQMAYLSLAASSKRLGRGEEAQEYKDKFFSLEIPPEEIPSSIFPHYEDMMALFD
jgi:hypothetical protein